jgi:hypothetical protein
LEEIVGFWNFLEVWRKFFGTFWNFLELFGAFWNLLGQCRGDGGAGLKSERIEGRPMMRCSLLARTVRPRGTKGFLARSVSLFGSKTLMNIGFSMKLS